MARSLRADADALKLALFGRTSQPLVVPGKQNLKRSKMQDSASFAAAEMTRLGIAMLINTELSTESAMDFSR
jgi:hypothetical protein